MIARVLTEAVASSTPVLSVLSHGHNSAKPRYPRAVRRSVQNVRVIKANVTIMIEINGQVSDKNVERVIS